MDIIAEIRRRHFVSGEAISSNARSLKVARPTVRKRLQSETEPVYSRQTHSEPKLGEFKPRLIGWLEADAKLPKNQRRTAPSFVEGLMNEGYQGGLRQHSALC